MVGLLRRLQLAALFDDLLRDDSKARQRCRAKRSRNRDVSSVTAACDDDSTDTRMIVPCIEGVPPAFEKDLEPCAEVHWRGVCGHSDIPQIAGAVSGWNVHATAKSDRQVREVAANADAFLVPFGRSPIAAGVVVPEFQFGHERSHRSPELAANRQRSHQTSPMPYPRVSPCRNTGYQGGTAALHLAGRPQATARHDC